MPEQDSSKSLEEQREEAFQRYLEVSEPYFDKVRDDGDEPWFGTIEDRRELFFRRYQRPQPPATLPEPSLSHIRGELRRWVPIAGTESRVTETSVVDELRAHGEWVKSQGAA